MGAERGVRDLRLDPGEEGGHPRHHGRLARLAALYAPGHNPDCLIIVPVSKDDATSTVSVAGGINGVGEFPNTHHLVRDQSTPKVVATIRLKSNQLSMESTDVIVISLHTIFKYVNVRL